MSKSNAKRYKDFDKFFSEQVKTPLTFTMFSTDYKLPSAMPAKLMVTILRSQAEDELQPAIILDICETLLGAEQFEDLLNKGMDIEQFEQLITWAVEEYGGDMQDKAGQEGNFPKEKS